MIYCIIFSNPAVGVAILRLLQYGEQLGSQNIEVSISNKIK
jgi:hypothetical protein